MFRRKFTMMREGEILEEIERFGEDFGHVAIPAISDKAKAILKSMGIV